MKNRKSDTVVTPIRGQIITVKELAAFIGDSPHAVRDWIEEGLPIAEKGGAGTPHKLNSRDCAHWWAVNKAGARRGRPPANGGSDQDGNLSAKDREQAAKAELTELKLAEARGELISQAALDQILEDTATEIRLWFLSFIKDNFGDGAVAQAEDFLNRLAEQIQHATDG